jgi:tetratricopeptide (TPR) repeat protein
MTLQRPAAVLAREWKIRHGDNIFTCTDLTILQRWVVEGKVVRDDSISVNGERWKRLGDIPELESFFIVFEDAARVRALEASLRVVPANAQALGGAPFAQLSGPVAHTLKSPAFAAAAPAENQPSAAKPANGWLPFALAFAGVAGVLIFLAWPTSPSGAQAQPVPPVETPVSIPSVPPPSPPLAPVALPPAVIAVDAGVAKAAKTISGATPATPSVPATVATANRQRRAGQLESAVRTYGEVLEKTPTNIEALTGQGLALTEMGQMLPAQSLFERALAQNARYGPALVGLADVHASLGNKAQAIEFYQKYLEALPQGALVDHANAQLRALGVAPP